MIQTLSEFRPNLMTSNNLEAHDVLSSAPQQQFSAVPPTTLSSRHLFHFQSRPLFSEIKEIPHSKYPVPQLKTYKIFKKNFKNSLDPDT